MPMFATFSFPSPSKNLGKNQREGNAIFFLEPLSGLRMARVLGPFHSSRIVLKYCV
jgi:hypothetical protein